jgi:hypothetical protein
MWVEMDKQHQHTFKELQAFTASIQLIHPQENIPYLVYSNRNQLVTVAILTQEGADSHKAIVSTASYVLTPTER